VPREIRVVAELPCTASGKVCRPDVVALFSEKT
jgi:acyl-coenzyme A synthetase/AMP-(fatty) acid ligase